MSLLVKLDLAPTSEPTKRSKCPPDRLLAGDPDYTTWLLADDVTGYNRTNDLPPRRATIVTASRLSRHGRPTAPTQPR